MLTMIRIKDTIYIMYCFYTEYTIKPLIIPFAISFILASSSNISMLPSMYGMLFAVNTLKFALQSKLFIFDSGYL